VLAGGVIERTKEIAVRTTVGASRASIRGHVGRQAISMAAIGMIVGGAVAGTMSRGLVVLLFEISPRDGLTYVGVAVLLLIAAVVSAIVPAWRAARIAPAVALQSPFVRRDSTRSIAELFPRCAVAARATSGEDSRLDSRSYTIW